MSALDGHRRAPRLEPAGPDVRLVVTEGPGSMDAYSQRLAAQLPVRRLHSDIYQRSAGRFNVPLASGASAKQAVEDLSFVRMLRRQRSPVHLPNHHLGRYGRFLSGPYVITVHDLIRYFDLHRARKLIHSANARDALHLRLDYAGVRKASAVIAVSETTRRDVIEHLRVPEQRVFTVANGVDHETFRPVARRLFDFPYAVFVGSEHPRKNLITLLRAMAQLRSDPCTRELRLVKVGRPGGGEAPFRERTLRAIRELGLEDRVVFTGRLSEEDLVACYSGAVCFSLPSLYEGFGLPPLEAMACGCPVVVSSAGSLLEVVGDAALIHEPSDERALASALREILKGDVARDLSARGLSRAARFSWRRTAAETLGVYEGLGSQLERRPPSVAGRLVDGTAAPARRLSDAGDSGHLSSADLTLGRMPNP